MMVLSDYHRDPPGRSKISQRRQGRGRAERRRKRPLLLLLTMALLAAVSLGGAWWAFKRCPLLRVQVVQVEHCVQLSPEEVSRCLEIGPNANILLLDLPRLAEKACGNPWVREASISRLLPHTLLVKISERRPVGCLEGKGLLLVSEDGVLLKPLSGRDWTHLPVFRWARGEGWAAGDRILSPLLQKDHYFWREFIRTLRSFGGQIREVSQSGDDSISLGLGAELPRLQLSSEILEEQFGRMKEVLFRYGIDWRTLEYIDLRYPGKVILKPRGKGGEGFGQG